MPDNLTCRVKMWSSSSETWWIKYFPGQWGVSDACLPVRNSYAGVKWYMKIWMLTYSHQMTSYCFLSRHKLH